MGNQNYKPYVGNIDRVTKINNNYRKVINTTSQQQLVVMSIKGNDNIPAETHHNTTQFIRIVEGNGVAILNGISHILEPETIVIIPAGTHHEIKNTNRKSLKLYTIYSPPEHPSDLIEKNKN